MKRFLLIIIASVMICTSCGSKEESSSSTTEVSLNDSSVESIDDIPCLSYDYEYFIDFFNEYMLENGDDECVIKTDSKKEEDINSGVFKGKKALIYENDVSIPYKFYVNEEKFYGFELLLNGNTVTYDTYDSYTKSISLIAAMNDINYSKILELLANNIDTDNYNDIYVYGEEVKYKFWRDSQNVHHFLFVPKETEMPDEVTSLYPESLEGGEGNEIADSGFKWTVEEFINELDSEVESAGYGKISEKEISYGTEEVNGKLSDLVDINASTTLFIYKDSDNKVTELMAISLGDMITEEEAKELAAVEKAIIKVIEGENSTGIIEEMNLENYSDVGVENVTGEKGVYSYVVDGTNIIFTAKEAE